MEELEQENISLQKRRTSSLPCSLTSSPVPPFLQSNKCLLSKFSSLWSSDEEANGQQLLEQIDFEQKDSVAKYEELKVWACVSGRVWEVSVLSEKLGQNYFPLAWLSDLYSSPQAVHSSWPLNPSRHRMGIKTFMRIESVTVWGYKGNEGVRVRGQVACTCIPLSVTQNHNSLNLWWSLWAPLSPTCRSWSIPPITNLCIFAYPSLPWSQPVYAYSSLYRVNISVFVTSTRTWRWSMKSCRARHRNSWQYRDRSVLQVLRTSVEPLCVKAFTSPRLPSWRM